MHLPHLAKVRAEQEWQAERYRELRAVLDYYVDAKGPEYVLRTLADAVEAWAPSARFTSGALQKELHVDAILAAADECEAATEARFKADAELGMWPVEDFMSKELDDARIA